MTSPERLISRVIPLEDTASLRTLTCVPHRLCMMRVKDSPHHLCNSMSIEVEQRHGAYRMVQARMTNACCMEHNR